MMLYYSVRGKVKLSMYDYVRKILEEVPEDMTGTAKMPVAGHLFTINESCEKLSEKKAQ